MVTLIADHWLRPDGSIEAFTRNTDRLKSSRGFVSRLVMRSLEDPTKLTTVTTWESREDYDAFMKELEEGRRKRDPNAPRALLGEKLEGFEVLGSA